MEELNSKRMETLRNPSNQRGVLNKEIWNKIQIRVRTMESGCLEATKQKIFQPFILLPKNLLARDWTRNCHSAMISLKLIVAKLTSISKRGGTWNQYRTPNFWNKLKRKMDTTKKYFLRGFSIIAFVGAIFFLSNSKQLMKWAFSW